MIWSIVSKEEMESYGTSPVFRFYQEAFGKDEIRLAVVDVNDNLDFVKHDDVVLLRTADPCLLDTIKVKGIKSTAEDCAAYELVSDKTALAKFLGRNGVSVPLQYSLQDVTDGNAYFVKPRRGSDSFGISTENICHSKQEVETICHRIKSSLVAEPVIEEFIDGVDCTCACCSPYGVLITAPIEVECEETCGIQTRDCKTGFKEYCHIMREDEKIKAVAKKVFSLLGLRHHARIDFRKDKSGNVFVIDVNLLPGLGPLDHFSKCYLLNENLSYVDTMRMIVLSATK